MTAVPTTFPEDRSAVRWGIALAGVAIFVIVGSFAFSYVYLWADAEAWPPPGHVPVDAVMPLTAVGLLVIGLVSGFLGTRPRVGHLWLAVSWISGAVAAAVLVAVAAAPEIRPTDHAYGSMTMVLLGSLVTVAFVAAGAALMVQLRSALGAPEEWAKSGRIAVQTLWIVVVVVAAVVMATAVAIPHWAPR